MNRDRFKIHLSILTVFFVLTACLPALAASVPRMSTDELKKHIGNEDYIVLDVRAGRDWDSATDKISGSKRVEAREINQWAEDLDSGKTIVLYCA